MIEQHSNIAPGAQLGENVSVHPLAIVEDDVVIGDNCVIEAFAMVRSGVRMGSGNHIHPHAVIGGNPQDLSFDPATPTFLEIGDNNTFREHVTLHKATAEGQATHVGSDCFFMNYSHAAHDCEIGDGCILANAVQLGGHVKVGERVFFGAGAMAHQFCRVGSLAMVAALIGVRKDVLPFALVGGEPVRHYRINTLGIRRSGVPNAGIKAISAAARQLRVTGSYSPDEPPELNELQYLQSWLAAESKRGIYGWADASSS